MNLDKFLETYSWIDDYGNYLISGSEFEKFIEGKSIIDNKDLARLFEGYDNWTKQFPNSTNQKWLKAIKEAGT